MKTHTNNYSGPLYTSLSTQMGGNSKNSKQDEGIGLEMGILFPEYPVPGSQRVGMMPKWKAGENMST